VVRCVARKTTQFKIYGSTSICLNKFGPALLAIIHCASIYICVHVCVNMYVCEPGREKMRNKYSTKDRQRGGGGGGGEERVEETGT